MAPSLLGLKRTLTPTQVKAILKDGRNAMPPIAIPDPDQDRLIEFLFAETTGPTTFVDGGLEKLLDDAGYPGTKPPWGTLSAIDLNSGRLVWKAPLGEYNELTQQAVPKTGTENFGGATVTAGGLVFCAGTQDLKIRAFDKQAIFVQIL